MNQEFNPIPEQERDIIPTEETTQANEASAEITEDTGAAAQNEEVTANDTAEQQPLSEEAPQPTVQVPYRATVNFNPYTGQPLDPSMQIPAQKPKKKGSFLKKAAAALALALIFGLTAGGVFLGLTGGFRQSGNEIQTPAPGIVEQQGGNKMEAPTPGGSVSGQLQSASDAMKEALEKAQIAAQGNLTIPQINIIMEPAMVSINCLGETTVNSFFGTQKYQTSSSGSGIIVGENDTELLIVTNNHVIADTTEISVVFVDGSESKALVKGTDAVNDLAIIVVNLTEIPAETMQAIAYAEIGDSDALVIGEGVVAIGNALGFGQSVTQGIVSALNRAVTDSNGNTTYLIQTDAAINPGNSGGALVNMKGQVIGINSAKYSDEAVEGMCFAIPVNTAMPILEELMSRTTRVEITDPEKAAYLGINYQDITASMAQAYKMPVGVYITAVGEGTPAEAAGLLPGDIITKFDHDIISGYSDLRTALSYYAAGEVVDIVVQRPERGQYVETVITITLGARPTDSQSSAQTPQNGNQSGSQNGGQNSGSESDYPSWFDYFGW